MINKHENDKMTVTLYGITSEDRERLKALKKRSKVGYFFRDAIIEKLDREEAGK